MNQDLIKCHCCGELLSLNDVELSYKCPSAIACMTQEEIDADCKYNDDCYVCEGKYFYIRCLLPLPIIDTDMIYCIGVWAQVSENGFYRIRELWDDEKQSEEPPFKGLLANEINFHPDSENIEIVIQLTGPNTRPYIYVSNAESALYKEQELGIPVHRANEYSKLCA